MEGLEFNITTSSNNDIKVIGVGGGGSNAVNHMFKMGIEGVDFAICNTDNQALKMSPVPHQIRLGPQLTQGRGAGARPETGREACLESQEDIRKFFSNDTKMVFVTAGMGGGTGTGAAPIVAKLAQELDILTVGIVTMPFDFEGRKRMANAQEGLAELKKNVDALIVISNDKLKQMRGDLPISEAFQEADDVLTAAAKGIAEIITIAGYVNVDFEDVSTVMRGSGVAIMGTGSAAGEDRARASVEAALNCPLLEDNQIEGSKNILLNITSGTKEITMDEIREITDYINEEAGHNPEVIWGNCTDETIGDRIMVTVIATGFEKGRAELKDRQHKEPIRVTLDDEPASPQLDVDTFDTVQETRTVEFRTSAPERAIPKPPPNSFEKEPYIKSESHDVDLNIGHTPDVSATNRQSQLHELRMKLNSPTGMNELENEPAFKRRKITLEDQTHSSENEMSNNSVSLDDEGRPTISSQNSYLHDNVD